MVSTDASNKRIVKLFPSVACPLPAIVTEKIAGFPSAEQHECGVFCYKFKQTLHLLLAKETGDFLIFFFWISASDDGNQLQLKCLCLSTSVNGTFLPSLRFVDYF